jgi:hypothetical protein
MVGVSDVRSIPPKKPQVFVKSVDPWHPGSLPSCVEHHTRGVERCPERPTPTIR